MRLLLRFPAWLYQARLGWLLGGRFLLLTHVGRRSGRPRRAVLEVVGRDPDSGAYFVASGWGERSQWLRNVDANPAVQVTVGRRRFEATAERLSTTEAERVLGQYGRGHGVARRAMAWLFGSADPRELAQALPVVALRRRA